MKINKAFLTFGFAILAATFVACDDDSPSDSLPVDMPAEEINDENLNVKPLEGNAFRVGNLEIHPIESNSAGQTASLTMTPSKTSNSDGGEKLNFQFNVAGFNLGDGTDSLSGSGKSNHIGLILNNSADTTFSGSTFSMDFTQGEYQLLAFLALPSGESLKAKNSHLIYDFSVGGTPSKTATTEKMVFITSPVSSVSDSGKGVLLDFLLFNAPLSDEEHNVNVHIDDKEFFFYKHQPMLIKGLSKGKHIITVQILDKYGKVIENAKNAISERHFEVK
jgi:hypothetical protein